MSRTLSASLVDSFIVSPFKGGGYARCRCGFNRASESIVDGWHRYPHSPHCRLYCGHRVSVSDQYTKCGRNYHKPTAFMSNESSTGFRVKPGMTIWGPGMTASMHSPDDSLCIGGLFHGNQACSPKPAREGMQIGRNSRHPGLDPGSRRGGTEDAPRTPGTTQWPLRILVSMTRRGNPA